MNHSKLNFHRKGAKTAERSGLSLAVERNGKLKKVNLCVLCDSAVNPITGIVLLLGY
jgi:hypothetical protein